MGGRGGSSGLSANRNTYEMRTRGQITRYEAGQLYKAVKSGDIKALPETTSMLYDQANEYIGYAERRYSQDYLYYDRVQKLTEHLINREYKRAQKIVNDIENDMIRRAGKKSRFYKYKNIKK